jgi:hypothetical protein
VIEVVPKVDLIFWMAKHLVHLIQVLANIANGRDGRMVA